MSEGNLLGKPFLSRRSSTRVYFLQYGSDASSPHSDPEGEQTIKKGSRPTLRLVGKRVITEAASPGKESSQ